MRGPKDLLSVTCLTDATWADDWGTWMRKADPKLRFTPRGPLFSLYALAVTEAINGAGVLMGHEALIRDELATGRMVAPFATRVALPRRLSIETLGKARGRDAVARVVALLEAQR